MLGLLKPEERVTFAALTMPAWSNYTLNVSLEQIMEAFTAWERALVIYVNLIQPVPFALSYRFYYRFPASVPRARIWSSLQYLLYCWAGILYARRISLGAGRLHGCWGSME